MSESIEKPTGIDRADPYTLTADGIKEPPVGWRASMRYFGPGLILSASIVGSGELIATTALGAQAGFVLLWLVIVSTLVKVAVQIEQTEKNGDAVTLKLVSVRREAGPQAGRAAP